VVNATPLSLSKGECALLLAFLESPRRSLSREHLLYCVTAGIDAIRHAGALHHRGGAIPGSHFTASAHGSMGRVYGVDGAADWRNRHYART